MSLSGKCKLLKIYISEDSKYKSHSLLNTLIKRFRDIGVAGATVYRGLEGYGRVGELHTTKILDLSTALPVIIEVVDTPENIEKASKAAKEIVAEGLIFIADVEVL